MAAPMRVNRARLETSPRRASPPKMKQTAMAGCIGGRARLIWVRTVDRATDPATTRNPSRIAITPQAAAEVREGERRVIVGIERPVYLSDGRSGNVSAAVLVISRTVAEKAYDVLGLRESFRDIPAVVSR